MIAPAPTRAATGPVGAPKRPKFEAPYPLVSQSQITNFEPELADGACERKWAFKSLLKLEDPQGEAAALGDDVDTGQLQPYLMEGKPIDYTRRSGYIAGAGLAYLPPPKTPGLECQYRIVMPTLSGPGAGTDSALFGYQGYLDLSHETSEVLPFPVSDKDNPDRFISFGPGYRELVGDFKTTGNLAYRKTPAKLKIDVQATLYAKERMWRCDVDEVDLAWFYLTTKGTPKCVPSYLRTTKDIVDKRFVQIEEAAHRMLQVRASAPVHTKTMADHVDRDDPVTKTKEWTDLRLARNKARVAANPKLVQYIEALEPNVHACDSFGGCPFRGECNRTLAPNQIIDALAFSAQRRRGVVEPDTNEPNEKDPMSNKVLAEMKAKKAALAAAAAAGTAPASSPPAPTEATPPAPAPGTGPINPPEAALPPADPVGSVNVEAPPAETEAPKAKGRPKGSKNAPKATEAAAPKAEDVTFESAPGAPDTFTVTWPEERYTLFGRGFGVGPISITSSVRPGEDLQTAMKRVHAEAGAFITKARELHAEKFNEHDPRLTPKPAAA
jgi:hypothetical protein